MPAFLSCLLTALLLSLSLSSVQAQADDGFLRRNGSTYLLRHGQLRPLTQEVHLPNGRTVTPEGFVLRPDGGRTQLAEGQGCDLRGNPVASQQQANGSWALAAPAASPAIRAAYAVPTRRVPPGQLKKWWKQFGKKHGRKHGD
ncbi:DUF6799 domain-containing protein [Hymenobacter jeollabukensis]|uniref:DUF6799 domain-containing protein n=1 Tax=Hymenobacter jeollabukensis TaxID=2025313 RepID=A0A5R8WS89_9BACT|nr:DUF6799 domain-containing protein [Hymenobacter jeollabukensis]TLM94064.1 hypothetical protein FDY95_08540 [Hymenobacter jeollabukensis]